MLGSPAQPKHEFFRQVATLRRMVQRRLLPAAKQ
jgi:hypothetical protein